MSLTAIKERTARDGSIELAKGATSSRYSRRFVATSDDRQATPHAIAADPLVPQLGSATVLAGWPMIVVNVRPRHYAGDPFRWEIDVDYSTINTDAQNPQNTATHPLDRPPDVAWDFIAGTQVVYEDANGDPITTSSKEFFDPPLEIEEYYPRLVIARNQLAYSPPVALEYTGAVNSDSFFGADPHQVRCAGITGRLQFEVWQKANIAFWNVVYEFHFRIAEHGWKKRLLDIGYYELDANGKQKHILDKQQAPVTSPVPLDGAGGQLTLGPNVKPVFLPAIEIYRSKPFADLQVP